MPSPGFRALGAEFTNFSSVKGLGFRLAVSTCYMVLCLICLNRLYEASSMFGKKGSPGSPKVGTAGIIQLYTG